MAQFKIKPYLLKNPIQHYAWGTKNSDAFIPSLLGSSPQKDVPYAELWMGTHPNAPSQVQFDSNLVTLPDLINTYPIEILGEFVIEKFNKKLPFLFKILSASEALSIQAHPNKSQAEMLHEKDPVNYPDDNHKPEIAIALDNLTALVGFRPLDEIFEVHNKFPELSDFFGQDFYSEIRSVSKTAASSDLIRQIYTRLTHLTINRKKDFSDVIERMADRIFKNTKSERETLFIELKEKYNADIGLISLYLLNLVHLKSGQAVFLKAGVPHAYLNGNIVECMANSDNVVRAGLTPKFQDSDTLLEILTFEPGLPEIIHPTENDSEYIYNVPTSEFKVKRILLKKSQKSSVQKVTSLQIIIVLKGRGKINWNNQTKEFKRGDSFLIPSFLESYHIFSENESEIFIAYVAP